MSSDLDHIILLGKDITSFKYYGLATAVVLLYDHLLTLGDEIKYAWSGRKSWAFWLFVFNRYFPMSYQVWQTVLIFGPQSPRNSKLCDKTAWYPILVFAISTFLAQVMLTVRIYAVTMKNNPIALGFAGIVVSQLGLGICMAVLAAKRGAQPIPSIPLDAYHICFFVRHRTLEITSACISLVHDFLAFSLIMFLVARSKLLGFRVPSILRTIAVDATRFFLVVFASHLILTMTLVFGREEIQLLPGLGNIAYLPLMVSRLMLSLRKAADPQQGGWSLMKPTRDGFFQNARRPGFWRDTDEGRDDIPLETHRGPRRAIWWKQA